MARSSARSQRKQARLSFTPLPSSSPATKGYHPQIRDRAAAVTLESKSSGWPGAMPTPAATEQRRSDPAHDESDSDSDIRPTHRRLTSGDKRKPSSRQARLDFSNARHPDTFSSPIRLSSPARTQSSGKSAGMFGKARSRVIDVSSDDDSDQGLPSPSALVPQQRGDDAPEVRSRKRRTRSTAKTTATDSASEDDNITVLAAPRSVVALESEDDDDDMPTSTGTQRRKRARRASPDSFIASSPPRVIDSDDDLEIVKQPRKRRRQAEESSNEKDEESVTPARQRGKMRRKLSQREQEELEDELDGLGPSSDVEASARKARNDQAAKKNVKQQALEKLKRMRSGQAKGTSQMQEEDDAVEPQPGSDASSQGDENYSEEEDVHSRPVRSSQMFEEDEDDANFIDSEDEPGNPLGIPDGLPLEYSRYASKKPKELFPHAVEWMVQKKINPAFQMNDAIYDLTFRKLDDEVTGLAGSKFKSSVWTSDFTLSLNSRPTIAFASIDRSEGANWMRDHCDACNRSNHPATFQIQFQGRPYYRKSLEDVAEDDSDDDSDSEDDSNSRSEDPDKPSHDEQGRQVPPPSKTYYVGKFCMSNAHTAHSLHHWRYHLNEWVIEWLTRNGYNNPDEVVKRDAWSTKKRRKFANKITDRMEKEGVIKQLYRDYRKNIDEARNSKQGRYGD